MHKITSTQCIQTATWWCCVSVTPKHRLSSNHLKPETCLVFPVFCVSPSSFHCRIWFFFVTPPSTFLAAGIFFSSAPSNLYRAASFCFALRYLTGVIIPPMPFLLSRFQVGACSFLSDNLRWRRKSCRKRPIVRIEVQCLCVNELT